MINFWSIIVESNLFNFVIVVLLFIYIFRKFNLIEKTEIFKKNVIDNLKMSSYKRKYAHEKLAATKIKIKNINSDISVKIKQIEEQTSAVIDNINATTDNNIKKIQNNINNFRENEINSTISRISTATLNSAIIEARQRIEKKLENNRELQLEHIYKSLESFERFDLSNYE